ncbi:hypothetical protein I551_8736 [Mycobacterium ulcerans str. Harvey]|uniref:Uncharacterized protein n=1 Tax=Mycobacterium ulcerans str. Harvey TaxID=1299332 RepID=A0ABN0RA01_MYCUL|nr:hypothetical protein I551_8736 [Mycobacterium ulcerans str. Harvey]
MICTGSNDLGGLQAPENVKLVSGVSHAAVFPACCAVVHHGGPEQPQRVCGLASRP